MVALPARHVGAQISSCELLRDYVPVEKSLGFRTDRSRLWRVAVRSGFICSGPELPLNGVHDPPRSINKSDYCPSEMLSCRARAPVLIPLQT